MMLWHTHTAKPARPLRLLRLATTLSASKNPAIKSRAHEIEATISLAGPSAQLKYDPATDIERARRGLYVVAE
jgi:hypothetical protein